MLITVSNLIFVSLLPAFIVRCNDNPQRLYKYIINSNIVNKRAPLEMLTGAKKGSPIVPSKSKLKL